MSKPLDALLANATDADSLTCTLSPESVQVILFALSFVETQDAWKDDYFDTVTDAEWEQITGMIAKVSDELL